MKAWQPWSDIDWLQAQLSRTIPGGLSIAIPDCSPFDEMGYQVFPEAGEQWRADCREAWAAHLEVNNAGWEA